jgi:hypothetical protein
MLGQGAAQGSLHAPNVAAVAWPNPAKRTASETASLSVATVSGRAGSSNARDLPRQLEGADCRSNKR